METLFRDGAIQVLVCTATLAWGVNFPARLVIVKGTEYYDGKQEKYVDFPITDVLQMMGRAGRPQFDSTGVACILVHAPKKSFYRRFLYSPFPVESSLSAHLADVVNAEIASGTITSISSGVEYLTWTFLFRRVLQNPSFYGLAEASPSEIRRYCCGLVDTCVSQLVSSGCVVRGNADDPDVLSPTTLGALASFYYVSHTTVGFFSRSISSGLEPGVCEVARMLCDAAEFAEVPVRHNEDILNETLAEKCPWPLNGADTSSSHVKAWLLVQAHMCGAKLPIADYSNDTRGVLDNASRVLSALMDVAASCGRLRTLRDAMLLAQCIATRSMPDAHQLSQAPCMQGRNPDAIPGLSIKEALASLPSLSRPLVAWLRSLPLLNVKATSERPGEVTITLEKEAGASSRSRSRKRGGGGHLRRRDPGWWVLLCTGSVMHAFKRVGPVHNRRVVNMTYGGGAAVLTVMSDTFRGLEWQVWL